MSKSLYGLKARAIQVIQETFAKFDEIDSVIIYGSRAKGNYSVGSDIDLTIKTKTKTKGKDSLLFKVIEAFDDLDLIYSFDISLFAEIRNSELIDHINRVGIEFYNRREFSRMQKQKERQEQYSKDSYQSEQALENELIKQLVSIGYEEVPVNNENKLLVNLKSQLEKHNKTSFSESEFTRIVNHLAKGNVFEKAKTLRDKFVLHRDDNSTKSYIDFINAEHWCKNLFQVTHQVAIEGDYKNRYDVTILINGLPLVHIELKRRGLELKEAFNQVNRYHRHSFQSGKGLFGYVQIFIISNGVNSKYYANNRFQSFKQTFYWADKDSNRISSLKGFTDMFLERCHLSKMICKYIVLAEVDKKAMVLRPYQYYAIEAIIDRVVNSDKNAYIWHTTGSGKTLTSFKASQILMQLPKVDKVVFVVDRKDLDYQTTKEFNSFSEASVDGTDNTKTLVRQFGDDTKLIVTTIQKLNMAINRKRYLSSMEAIKDKHIVFIFDECHRSQFGETHRNIIKFFKRNQMIGFTGTPIFKDNAVSNKTGKHTTAKLFDDCLHKYVIIDAIKDENVLKFSVEYVGRYEKKESDTTYIDTEVEDIDTKELLESEDRLNKITDYIIANHNNKTHNKKFNAMMAVSGINVLTKYYDLFKVKKDTGKHNLKIATIFSYSINEDDKAANGLYGSDGVNIDEDSINEDSRDKLESYIADYNEMFNTKFTTKDSQSYYNYYNDISRRVKKKEIDILLVVNMFLTGFDAKTVNTLYVDKNLRYHGLIQAFSRTNRIVDERKSHGNIICFRNLKSSTDEAIALFSNKDAKEIILMQPYEEYVRQFNEAFASLKQIVANAQSVDDLTDENEQLKFIKAFRELMRLENILNSFSDFSFDDLLMSSQDFENYKSKYLDLYERVKSEKGSEKVSILEDVDFKLELIHRDEINITYILGLLAGYREADKELLSAEKRNIMAIVDGEPKLRSKRTLIEEFIDNNLMGLSSTDDIASEFDKFLEKRRKSAFIKLCKDEGLRIDAVKRIVERYLYDQRKPLNDDIVKALENKPKLLERKSITTKVINKILSHIEEYY